MNPSTLDSVIERVVKRGLVRRKETPIKYLGIDEKALRRGHRQASALTGVERGRVWDLHKDRKTDDALMLPHFLIMRQKASLKGVGMDMWPGFMCAVRLSLPGAEIVHGRFVAPSPWASPLTPFDEAMMGGLERRETTCSGAASTPCCGAGRTEAP